MILDDALIQIPVPKPWMDRVIKHPLVADTYPMGQIPIPRWSTVDEDTDADDDSSSGQSPTKKQKLSSPGKSEAKEDEGDEDISDARFTALHQPYETLEKRLQKYFVNSQQLNNVNNNTNAVQH
jgi:hypothetical protein